MATDLTQGPVGPLLMRFAVPFVLANLLQTVYGIVDASIVGHFVGADGLSAVSTCGELITMYTFLAIGFGSAGQTMIGQLSGAGEHKRINDTIGTLFTCLFGLAVLVTGFCFATWRWQLGLINLPQEAMQGGKQYLLVCASGMVFIFGYNLVSAILRGMGDSKRPLVFVAIAALTNVVLDLLFVPVCGMGVFGAALATVMGQALSFVVSLIYLYRHRQQFGFDFRLQSFRPNGTLLKTAFKLGIPMSAQGVLVCASMLFICAQANAFGVAASAANGIQLKLCSIVRVISSSMQNASAAMIAQCIGAKKNDRVHEIIRWGFGISLVGCLACAGALLLWPRAIFSIFNSEEAVLAYAAVYAWYGAGDYFGYALRVPFNGLTYGTGAAGLGMISGLVDGVISRIAFSVLFGNVLGMGVAGYWLGNMVAGYTSVLIQAPYYFTGAWKRKKLELGE